MFTCTHTISFLRMFACLTKALLHVLLFYVYVDPMHGLLVMTELVNLPDHHLTHPSIIALRILQQVQSNKVCVWEAVLGHVYNFLFFSVSIVN